MVGQNVWASLLVRGHSQWKFVYCMLKVDTISGLMMACHIVCGNSIVTLILESFGWNCGKHQGNDNTDGSKKECSQI